MSLVGLGLESHPGLPHLKSDASKAELSRRFASWVEVGYSCPLMGWPRHLVQGTGEERAAGVGMHSIVDLAEGSKWPVSTN